MSAVAQPKVAVHYPDSDGEPIADNTLQFDWVAILKWGAETDFQDRPDVFVAGDHLIYPSEGDDRTRQAPDVYVAFGRPKGHRGSYRVWEENDVFPQVVFEVWSPRNRFEEMRRKFGFYDRYGAEEYYILYPDFPGYLEGWVRTGGRLDPVADMHGHVSPRLGWRFTLTAGRVAVYGQDGRLLERPDQTTARLVAERDRLAAKLRELGVDPDAV